MEHHAVEDTYGMEMEELDQLVPVIDPKPFRGLRKRAAKGKRAPKDTHGKWATQHALLLQRMHEISVGAMLPQPMSEELVQLSF